eukprot:6979197-Prymnesium_polylepis.1
MSSSRSSHSSTSCSVPSSWATCSRGRRAHLSRPPSTAQPPSRACAKRSTMRCRTRVYTRAHGATRRRDACAQVNSCLLPVVIGVAIASAAELNFTWDCFAYAMGSNLAFSLRGVMTKKSSSQPKVRTAKVRARTVATDSNAVTDAAHRSAHAASKAEHSRTKHGGCARGAAG